MGTWNRKRGTGGRVTPRAEEMIPKDLASAVKDIKLAILQARAKAAHLANAEALKLYFFVGGYISKKTRNAKWGSGAIDALSNQLQVELPGLRGFSPQHMRFMRQFFEAWASVSPIHPREVFCEAVRYRAFAIIVAHNHPSGDLEPSKEDIEITERLIETIQGRRRGGICF